MSLKENLNNIRKFILNRYKENLATILIFGSANTGHFIEGKSDIDTIILLKDKKDLNLEKERQILIKKLEKEHFHTQYLYSLEGAKKHINRNNRKGWSIYITLIAKDGSLILYSTPEFKELKKELKENPPTKEDIKKYLREKDEFELNGYFKKEKEFILTKALMSHLRRKLQIINYYQNKNLFFNYKKCLDKIELSKNRKEKLKKLYNKYENREILTQKEIKDYYNIAKKLTKKISEEYGVQS